MHNSDHRFPLKHNTFPHELSLTSVYNNTILFIISSAYWDMDQRDSIIKEFLVFPAAVVTL